MLLMTPGTRLGQYEIVDVLGAGGMGEVYRARDSKLGRTVAIKVLLPAVASDADRLVRFEREAKALASLNHPNIAQIYGLEDAPGGSFLAMELVEGPTLADRIARGPIALDEALKIARQIADALEAAHEQGIIHRDLKPANVKVRPDGMVKVLDFGLAKVVEPVKDSDLSRSPTVTSPARMTHAGVILGTAAYMSPEQARGQTVDKRTDIWAFGCVLYEMLTGRPVYGGHTVTDVLAAIIEREPDWKLVPDSTPTPVRHILARCLEKDAQRRWRDIGDVRIELDDADAWFGSRESATPRKGSRVGERAAWIALAVAAAAAAAVVTPMLRNRAMPAEIRFDLLFPHDVPTDFAQLAMSPDGEQIAVAPNGGGQQPTPLWLRPLSSSAGRSLAGTEGATFPFWSPDGESIGFFADGKLKRLDVKSQATAILADAPLARGGAWQPDGAILFAPNATGPLFRVPADGSQPSAVVTHLENGQNDHRAPVILPDGQHFLYYARGGSEVRGIWVARLDGTDAKRLLDADAAAVYSASGHLLFVRQTEMFAQPFDTTRLALTGDAVRVTDRISVNPGLSLASLAASRSGSIAYGTGSIRRTQFVWFDRSGKRLETLGPADETSLANPELSPDGQQLAFSRFLGGNWDIWLIDMQGAMSQFTSTRARDFSPIWSFNGRQIFFQSNNSTINSRPVNGGAPEQMLLRRQEMMYPSDVSPDGHVLLYTRAVTSTTDLWYVPLAGDTTPHSFVETMFQERDGQFSPDGKWVAYQANDSGHFEIYLQPFPGPGERIPVSAGGGQQPRWAKRSGELFYIAGDQRLMSVPVTFAPNRTPVLGQAVPLFRTEFDNNFQARQQYVVSPDGQRFLINASTNVFDPPSITLILNWKGAP